jgi:hypothetical protein
MTVPQKHQFKIAKQTLRYSDVGALIMGGMTKDEAREFLVRIAGWTYQRVTTFENA